MKAPKENLEEFISANSKPFASKPEPPHLRLVAPSGSVKVLKPLTQEEVSAEKVERRRYVPPTPFPGAHQEFSWFVRSLAVGGGVVAMITFTILSSIFIAVFEPAEVSEELHAALPRQEIEGLVMEQPLADLENNPDVTPELRPVALRAKKLSRPAARTVYLAAYKMRRTPRKHLVRTNFVPTKLIIYPDKGVIKTRIEPQLTAAYYPQNYFPN